MSTYEQSSSRYINFNSAGQLWNRVLDETYRNGKILLPEIPWRETPFTIVKNFTGYVDPENPPNPDNYEVTLNPFYEIQFSSDLSTQILNTSYTKFYSFDSGVSWNELDYFYNDIYFKLSRDGNYGFDWGYYVEGELFSTYYLKKYVKIEDGFGYVNIGNPQSRIFFTRVGFPDDPVYFNPYGYDSTKLSLCETGVLSLVVVDDEIGSPNCIIKSIDNGNTWIELPGFNDRVYGVDITDYTCSYDGQYIYAVADDRLIASSDGGLTSHICALRPDYDFYTINYISDVKCSEDGSIVVVQCQQVTQDQPNIENIENKLLYISRDYGNTWTLTGPDNFQNIPYYYNNYGNKTLSMSSDGKTIACFTKKVSINSPAVLFISDDYGQTWKETVLSEFVSGNLYDCTIHDISVSPDGSHIFLFVESKFGVELIQPYIRSISGKEWTFDVTINIPD